ncbi:MAG: RluA family pseudouridine synthase [Oscillospiraceae bacterium]|nr:RluA family pseudouridine synthase [Oscillospiraceae bacterium]
MERVSFFISSSDRLDKLVAENAGLSRSLASKLIEGGFVTVDKKTADKKSAVKLGAEVVVEIPDAEETEILPENIPLDIVYEDDDLLIVNKPKGMVVHPAAGHYSGTLVNALMYHCKDSLSGINGELRPGIVHRIDKDTSGLLMVAKNDFAHIGLSEQIKEHSFTREYQAVACGCIKENGTVNAPIGRHKTDRKKMCVTAENSREAVTHYSVIRNYAGYTHLLVRLETGRTHQIRVHLSYIGHPVAGDEVYGSGKPKWLGGQCLHARKVGFVHPRTGEYMEFSSELPDYFTRFLKEIEKQ